MNKSKATLQDRNAGNLGDLIKHYWLLKLVNKLVGSTRPGKVAYLESHSGSGRYLIGLGRGKRVFRQRGLVSGIRGSWDLLDKFNDKIKQGIYYGSFPMVLRMLSGYSSANSPVCAASFMWEKDPVAVGRIREYWNELVPVNMRKTTKLFARPSDPGAFIAKIRELQDAGYTPVWLCDPFWGFSTGGDKVWWRLLRELPDTFGIIFSYSAEVFPGKSGEFASIIRSTRAPEPPFKTISEKVTFGIHLTKAAKNILDCKGRGG
jgi:hypothetical protein